MSVHRKGFFHVKKNHDYFFQIQGQLLVTEAEYCGFVVFTNVEMCVVRVWPGKVFMEDCLKKAKQFF